MSGLPLLNLPADSSLPVLASAFWGSPAVFAVAAAAGCAAFASGWAIERRRRQWANRMQQASAMDAARLRAQVEEAADPFLVAEGEDGRIVLANRAASELLGHAHGQLVGMSLTELYPEESRHEMSDRYRRSLRRNGVGTHELFLGQADGGAVPVLLRWKAIATGGQRCMQVSLRDLRPAKAAERELRESEARYAALFESIPIAVLEKDYGVVFDWLHRLRERGVQDVTDYLRSRPIELVTLYGSVQIRSANRSALRGMDLLEAAREGAPASPDEIPAHLLQLFLRELEALWDGRAHMSCTLEHLMSDGSLGHALVHWSLPRQDSNAERRTALVVFTDLTELRAAQERLHLSEERPRLALQGFNVGIWETDLLSGISHYSERCKRMLGYEPDELGSRREDWADLVHPEDRARVDAAQLAHQSGLSPRYEAEYRLRCKDGSYKWILDRGQAVRDPMGRALRIVGALEDISDKKASEEALKAGQTRYRQLFENSPIAIVEADLGALADWFAGLRSAGTRSFEEQVLGSPRTLQEAGSRIRFTELNPAALRLLRAVDREAAFAVLMPGPEETRRMWSEIFQALWQGRNELEGEAFLKPSLGAPVRAMYRWWVPAPVPGAGAMRCLLVLADLSEITRAENALVAEQLRSSKLESLGILAGGIAHDFNNLLTVVMGNLTLAMMEPQAMASAGRWMRESEKGVLKARDLTQQLLTIAKGGDPIRSAVALADIVREAAEFALHGSKVRPVFSFAPGLQPADVDKGQIGQVVQNLVINAVQAMPQGGTIRLSLSDAQSPKPGGRGPCVLLTVEDTGVGIPEEHLAKIFDPYFTTKAQGSGLGLATVYSIVRKHGGEIDVASVPGRGTTFRIWLPAARGQAMRHEVPDTSGPRARTGRILFMDDEEPLRRLGQALLQSLGYDVRAVADGSAVAGEYETARRIGRPFDLVLLDLTVPGGMGALEALAQVRVKDPAVRAVVMSGYASDPVCTDHRAHGFRGVIPKPYRVGDLGRTIQTVLSEP